MTSSIFFILIADPLDKTLNELAANAYFIALSIEPVLASIATNAPLNESPAPTVSIAFTLMVGYIFAESFETKQQPFSPRVIMAIRKIVWKNKINEIFLHHQATDLILLLINII